MKLPPRSSTSHSTGETRAAGARIAAAAEAGDTFGLIGKLGAGKTEFVRGFTACFARNARVTSPSFSLLNIYDTLRFPVYHFDFYRLNEAEELIEIGFEEYTTANGICLIEWADMFPEVMPVDTIYVCFEEKADRSRLIEVGK
ncbi:MAG: tRNA (adenosine(37)-N6)-threonylcarbamoyltransferase complex ATPase subunit type 1 TsaE [Chitinivibrionales bacterium]|nr:tRNA (adenosine(37)-N6)-threonylcarbamoyltransferase complex ATPase subunit type 1 TsaE [Chitinivibrionales bacterium]